MAREKGSICGAVLNEACRIVLFLAYYLALICLGVIILIGAIRVADYLGTDYLPRIESGRGAIAVIGAIAGILSLAGIFGIYLIKPLFSFTKSANAERVEVKESDCPKLFDLIRKLSKSTGFRMPRHVYLTTDVNACVFYNTGFWSIFLPVRKNLEIGLGIFNATTIQEVKAVLAHEFGHFGQKSMKVGSAVAVTNKVLYNLIYTDDFIDKALVRWRNAGWAIWQLFGVITYALTSLVKLATVHVFLFVQRGERKLSRLMEFGADEVACRCAGTDAFISAMCKIEILGACDANRLRPFLKNILSENKLPENYFKAHDVVAEELRKEGWPVITPRDVLKKPFDFGTAESRLNVKDIWSTHPELSDRLDYARELSLPCGSAELEPSWTLIPDEVSKRVSDRFFELGVSGMEEKPVNIGVAEFHDFVSKSYAENGFPLEIEPIFGRVFEKFDLQNAFDTCMDQCPFNDEYRRLVAELNTAKRDMEILNQVVSGEIEVRTFTYGGVEYTKKNAPVEQHKTYLGKLVKAVSEKDAASCSYMTHLGDEAQREKTRRLYEGMAKIETLYAQVSERLATHDGYLQQYFSNADSMEEDEYRGLCVRIVALEKDFHSGIKALAHDIPDAIPKDEVGRVLLEYPNKVHNSEAAYSPESFQELQSLRELFGSVCNDFHRKCRVSLSRIASKIV